MGPNQYHNVQVIPFFTVIHTANVCILYCLAILAILDSIKGCKLISIFFYSS